MYIFNVAQRFSQYPGGRKATDGPHSGEEFLYTCLVPLLDMNRRTGRKVMLDFTYCVGATIGFFDESIGELAMLFGAAYVTERFEFTGRGIVEEIPNVIERADKAGKVDLTEHEKVKATTRERQAVQSFMEWCESQTPSLHLAVHQPDDLRGFMVKDVDWKKYCTKWLEIDEQKLEKEKRALLKKMDLQNKFHLKYAKWAKEKKGKAIVEGPCEAITIDIETTCPRCLQSWSIHTGGENNETLCPTNQTVSKKPGQ